MSAEQRLTPNIWSYKSYAIRELSCFYVIEEELAASVTCAANNPQVQ